MDRLDPEIREAVAHIHAQRVWNQLAVVNMSLALPMATVASVWATGNRPACRRTGGRPRLQAGSGGSRPSRSGYILTGKPHMLRLRGSRVAGWSAETPLRLFMAFLRTVGQGAIDMKSSVTWLVLVLLLMNLLAACAPGPNQSKGTENEQGSVAGFWLGLWQGFIAPFVFVASLFKGSLGIYEVHNNGAWYNFGYLSGLACFFGGGGSGAARRRKSGS